MVGAGFAYVIIDAVIAGDFYVYGTL